MIRVTITRAQGSTPRAVGAVMAVTDAAITGSIGGGALEYMAIDRARQMLRTGEDAARMDVPLGPEIGQCCGGRVVLDLRRVAGLAPGPPVPDLLIFGAGHVGRALAQAARPLPMRPVLIDSRADEMALAPPGIATRLTPLPEAVARDASPGAAVVVVTHDHALDFLIAAQALARGDLAYVGMIGSATKRARFARFAAAQGVDAARLVCPIGAAGRPDKRPAVIAAHSVTEILTALAPATTEVPRCAI